MHEFLIFFAFFSMFLAPVMIAYRTTNRDGILCAIKELRTLESAGKRNAGTLYSVPGYVVVQPNSALPPSAESRVA